MGGWPGMGPRMICPGERAYPELHLELEKEFLKVDGWKRSIERYNYLRSELPKYRAQSIQFHLQDLQDRIHRIENIISALRIRFKDVHNVKGCCQNHMVIDYYPCSRTGAFLDEEHFLREE